MLALGALRVVPISLRSYCEPVITRVGVPLLACLVALFSGCGGGGESSRAVLPFEDDFSSCEPEVDEAVAITCLNGEVKFLFKNTETRIGHYTGVLLPRSMRSLVVESDVRLESVSGDASKQLVWGGVVCFASEEDEPAQGYEFVVLPGSHEFAILLLDETDSRLEPETRTKPLYLRASPTVKGVGSPNRVHGECRESKGTVDLTMVVNGEQLGHATDSRFRSFEQAAIQTTSIKSGTDIRFDNFSADQID